MRIIDADRAKEIAEVSLGDIFLQTALKLLIDKVPTLDAVPVVHGRWVPVPSSDMMTGKAYKCSECGKMRYGSFMPNYCQNCGADMRGDGNV